MAPHAVPSLASRTKSTSGPQLNLGGGSSKSIGQRTTSPARKANLNRSPKSSPEQLRPVKRSKADPQSVPGPSTSSHSLDGMASRPAPVEPAPESDLVVVKPVLRQCKHCEMYSYWLPKHVAKREDCRLWYAEDSQRRAHEQDQSTQPAAPEPYHPWFPPTDEQDLGDDLPVEDQPPHDYDIEADYSNVARLREHGFFAADKMDIDLDHAPIEPGEWMGANEQEPDTGEDFDPDPFDDSRSDGSNSQSTPSPSPPSSPPPSPSSTSALPGVDDPLSNRISHVVDELYSKEIFKLQYPSAYRAGVSLRHPDGTKRTWESDYVKFERRWREENLWGSFRPFKSQMEWDVAQWAKCTGPTMRCVNALLNIPQVSFFSPELKSVYLT